MKQSVPPAVVVVAIVVVVLIAGFLGYRMLRSGHSGTTLKPEDYQARMAEQQKKQDQGMAASRSRMGGGGMSGGMQGGGAMSGGMQGSGAMSGGR